MIGVITADIVDSRKISSASREQLYKDLSQFLADLQNNKKLISSYEVFRGDSFQCLIPKTQHVFTVALLIRAFIKSYTTLEERQGTADDHPKNNHKSKGYALAKHDIRMGIGIGNTDFIGESPAHSDGEAFYNAGAALDRLKNSPYRIGVGIPENIISPLIEPTVLLLDAVIQKWTSNQAEIVFYKLQNRTEEEIASALKISQSAVNQRSKTSQWTAIEKLLDYFKNNIKD